MVIFHGYVKLPDGSFKYFPSLWADDPKSLILGLDCRILNFQAELKWA
jgi:hypothetical protein